MPTKIQDHPLIDTGVKVYSIRSCFLGYALIVSSNRGVCRVELESSLESLQDSVRSRYPTACQLEDVRDGIERRHFDHETRVLSLIESSQSADDKFPLDLDGTDFQKDVWKAMREIPFGKTTTYQSLAAKIARPDAVRAVANACGANPVAVLIPCHRVLRSDGGLGGFRWGVERKRALLKLEGVLPSVEQQTLISFD